MLTLARARVVSVVGEERLTTAVQDEVDQLVAGILTADVQLTPVVKLLGGQRPDASETRAGTYMGTVEGRGRWGR
eukprot:4037790-Pleurochrysis_carterae.AAC.1